MTSTASPLRRPCAAVCAQLVAPDSLADALFAEGARAGHFWPDTGPLQPLGRLPHPVVPVSDQTEESRHDGRVQSAGREVEARGREAEGRGGGQVEGDNRHRSDL